MLLSIMRLELARLQLASTTFRVEPGHPGTASQVSTVLSHVFAASPHAVKRRPSVQIAEAHLH